MENLAYPIALVVLSNMFYHICAKNLPKDINPFATLFIVYIIAAVCTGLVLLCGNLFGGADAISEIKRTSWPTIIIGISIVGLELGFIWAYRAGWSISLAALVANMCVSVALILVGIAFYKETLSWHQIAGVVLCAAGLMLVNRGL